MKRITDNHVELTNNHIMEKIKTFACLELTILRKGLFAHEWIKKLGKDKLQAFQDALARMFGISLCLLSLDGKALTVWSNSSLFCHYMLQKNRSRCLQERENVIKHVLKNNKPNISTCYMGLTFFICPVFYNRELICIAYGGGVKFDSQEICNMSKVNVDSNIPAISEKKLKDMITLLEETFNLITPEEGIGHVSSAESPDSPDLFFLQNKLSKRELQIVQLIYVGLGNREIGEQLFISEKTVKTHVSNILTKLGMKDRMQLIVFCRQNNLG